ncbi:MAG: extensin family protein [Kofleriaceae bacterium]|nr:extensin family protein [Kofleriaceae bacterium]
MSMRTVLLAAVIAGVVCPPAVHAETTSSARVAKKKKKKKKAKKTTTKAKKKREKVSRTPTKSSLRNTKNMPRGYAWPPSRQMLGAEKACRAKLDELGVIYKPAKREGRIVDALTVSGDDGAMVIGGISYRSAYRKGPHKLDCQLALALHNFGPTLYELGVREVTFGSIYRWTNVRVNGQTKNILSRHALGIAMDIVSITDETGRVATVKNDYAGDDALLRSVEEAVNASGKFRTLLTPKNDPVSHGDHFHIEAYVDYTAPAS